MFALKEIIIWHEMKSKIVNLIPLIKCEDNGKLKTNTNVPPAVEGSELLINEMCGLSSLITNHSFLLFPTNQPGS